MDLDVHSRPRGERRSTWRRRSRCGRPPGSGRSPSAPRTLICHGASAPCPRAFAASERRRAARPRPRHLARRDRLRAHAGRDRPPIQPEPRWAGLIAGPDRAWKTLKPDDRLLDPGSEPHPRHSPVAGRRVDRRCVGRPRMDIKPCARHRSKSHGRTSSRFWGQPEPSLRPDTPPRGASGLLPRRSTRTGRPAIGPRERAARGAGRARRARPRSPRDRRRSSR